MKRSPLKRVSKKRSSQLREYSKLRKQFLADHPYCQVVIRESGANEQDVIDGRGFFRLIDHAAYVPPSTEIHHMNKRHGSRLNDTKYWLAVCRSSHVWLEENKKEARLRGYLMDI